MNVLIVHFRSAPRNSLNESQQRTQAGENDSAGTDGVSLEMMKRTTLLEDMGHQVAICSAYNWADFPVTALEFDSNEAMQIMQNLFGPGQMDLAAETKLKRAFDTFLLKLKRELGVVITDFKPGVLFAHNILSLPVHPVATVALTQLLRESQLPCAAIHHDILSEGAYKFTPTCDFAREILDGSFPPTMANLRHWVINSRNQKMLKKRGIEAGVVPDTMDFDLKPDVAKQAETGASLRKEHDIKPNDIVLLVGARIVPNKQTELAGHLTATLQSLHQEMVGRKLYNGEVFSNESRVVLVVAGRTERAFADYQDRLFRLFDTLGIDWMYLGNEVRPIRPRGRGFCAVYPDMCAMADFVLYTSSWEGFGSMLLRAFAARLPVVVFEYPVFKEDIAPKGVRVVSLGDDILEERDSLDLVQLSAEVLDRAAHKMIAILTTPNLYRSIANHNLRVGQKYFSFDVLRAHLREVIDWAQSFTI